MTLYTIGFTQKTAETFFGAIRSHQIEMLVDVRLNNRSQLAGFTKGDDLRYFLDQICRCRYEHCVEFAPSKDIFDGYKKKNIDWNEYVAQFIPLMQSRNAVEKFMERFSKYDSVCLLCSEPTPEYCHRRLLAEMIAAEHPEISVKHL